MATPALKLLTGDEGLPAQGLFSGLAPRFLQLLEGLDTLAFLLDPEWRLLCLTPAAATFLAATPLDLGRPLAALLPRLGEDHPLGQLLSLMQSSPPPSAEFFWQGRVYDTRIDFRRSSSGDLDAIVVQLLERPTHERLELALQHRDALLQLMTDALPMRLAYIDRARRCRCHALRYDRWRGFRGLVPSGRPLRELLGEIEYQAVEPYVALALSGQQVSFQYEVPGAAGTRRRLAATYVPHRDRNQQLLGFYSLTSDLTDWFPLAPPGSPPLPYSREAESTRLLRLLHCVASVSHQARSLNEAISLVLLQVSQQMGWCFAQAYRPRPHTSGVLVPLETCYELVPGRFENFRQALLHHNLRTGQGLAQRAYACGSVQWAYGLRNDLRLSDGFFDAESPIESAVALPVTLGDRVVAVLEFFSREHLELHNRVLTTLESISTLLAVVAERDQAAEESRQRALRVHAIVHTAADGIITVNEDCRIESANPAAERLFGYRVEELLGRDVSLLIPFPDPPCVSFGTLLEGLVGKPLPVCFETCGHRKDGTTFPIDLAVSEIYLADRRLYAALVRDITERKRVEKHVLEMSTHEQQRIGYELHDELGQELTGLSYLAKHLQRTLHERQLPEAQAAENLATGLQRAIGQVRSIAKGLVPAQINAEVLVPALHALAANLEERYGMICQAYCEAPVHIHTNHKAVHLYRIAQEASRNAVKHGRARHISLALSSHGTSVVLEIRDDGLGLRAGSRRTLGLGMKIMQYRARLIGGSLEVRPLEGGGTRVICTVHQDEPNEQEH